MGGEVLILVNIPNSHFLLSLTHSALKGEGADLKGPWEGWALADFI